MAPTSPVVGAIAELIVGMITEPNHHFLVKSVALVPRVR
jgi:hypothetical protein